MIESASSIFSLRAFRIILGLNLKILTFVFSLVIFTGVFAAPINVTPQDVEASTGTAKIGEPVADDGVAIPDLRVETVPVQGGAEIITIFGRSDFYGVSSDGRSEEIPLVSVLRDTLGDDIPENDQLRYIWVMTHAKPGVWQRAASFVPFLYFRTSNKTSVGTSPPRVVADIRRSNRKLWNQIFWTIFRRAVLNQMGAGVKLSGNHVRRNSMDLNKSAVATALAVMSVFEKVEGQKVLSDPELKDIQARLWLRDKPLGWHMRDENLHRTYDKEVMRNLSYRLHNWELLRQSAEAQGLYFDPLEMPDESATHAMLWIDADELLQNGDRGFESRFLNIKNPWKDKKLHNWKGYVEERWFDQDSRIVEPNTPGAVPKRLIPLALYGLDNPKIPMILVDFRNNFNPKSREMSKRILEDVTNNVLSMSKLSPIPYYSYFFGRILYDFSTGRRGMDMNQMSRLRTYAQLKTLLALDHALDPDLRRQISRRLEHASMNPLENDLAAQVGIARANYNNLMAYARRPDGLPAKLDRGRRKEMVKFKHGQKAQFWFKTANIVSLGLYQHREKASPELTARLSIARQLEHHERMLMETSAKSVDPQFDTDLGSLRRTLLFVSEHGKDAGNKTSSAIAKIFNSSSNEDIRMLCITALYRIENEAAKKELLAIYENDQLSDKWRVATASYLRRALVEGQRISKRDAASISEIPGN